MRRNTIRSFFIASAALCLAATYASTSARADQVGHWTFDGDALDSSGFGNNGVTSGTAFSGDVPAFLGGGMSMDFNGAASVIVADSASLDITGAFTTTAWVKPTLGDYNAIVFKGPSPVSAVGYSGNYEVRLNTGNNAITYLEESGFTNGLYGWTSPLGVPLNQWSHIAVTVENHGDVTFYINGQVAGRYEHTGFMGLTNNQPLIIGNRDDGFTSFNGLMDDVQLFNEALTQDQISAIAGTAAPSLPDVARTMVRATSNFSGRTPWGVVDGGGLWNVRHSTNETGNMWLSSGATAPNTQEFELDLGFEHLVDGLNIWNYSENANPTCCLARGVRNADVYVAGEDGVYGAAPVMSIVDLPQSVGDQAVDMATLVNLGGVQARYVKIDITSNWGDPTYVGLSEISVDATPIPNSNAPLPIADVVASSRLEGFLRGPRNLANGNGQFADTHTNAPDRTMWLSQGTLTNVPPDRFDQTPEVTFDLGSVVALESMKVWNYNEFAAGQTPEVDAVLIGRGVATMEVLVAGEDEIFSTLISVQSLAIGPALSNVDFSETIDMLGTSARYVKLRILSNHNGRDFTDPLGDDGATNFAGLSEVQFFAVPEPASGALLFVSMAAVALSTRRSRRRAELN